MTDPTNPSNQSWPGSGAVGTAEPGPPDGAPAASARCAIHPEVSAETLCERCGSYACATCTVWRPDGTILCAPCSRRFAFGEYGSWLAIGAAVAGFLGLGCAPFGPLAVLLGGIDLVRIQTRQSPKGGWKLDALGAVLGVVGTILWVYVAYTWLVEPEPPGDPYYYGEPYY